MGSIAQKKLFGWEEIEGLGELARLGLVMEGLPDEALLRALEKERGRGRNDYPVRAMWKAVVAGVVFQHPSVESLRRELSRNGQLRWVCDLAGTPPSWAFTRFLKSLAAHAAEVAAMFETLVAQMQEALPELGRHLAHDGKALASHGRADGSGKSEDGRREREADIGAKTRRQEKRDGTVYEQVRTWFGFRVHLLVDAAHEMPLARKVTKASTAETPVAHAMLDHLQQRHPGLLGRAETYTADREYDDGKLIRRLWDTEQIKPVIGLRHVWKKESDPRRLVKGRRHVSYDEDGQSYCHAPRSGEAKAMAYGGFEADRRCQKWRCPAMHDGITCAEFGRCRMHAGVRVPLDQDRRIFTTLARPSLAFERAYRRRSAVERVNARIDQSFGFERHFIRGLAKMTLRVDLALTVMLAMALGRIRQKDNDRLRSLVQPAA